MGYRIGAALKTMATFVRPTIVLFVLVALFLSCTEKEKPALPPGPETAEQNLMLYDAFYDRIDHGAAEGNWKKTTRPEAYHLTKTIGLKPMLGLLQQEETFWRSHLRSEQDQRIIDAISDKVVRSRSETIPEVLPLLSLLRYSYARMLSQLPVFYIEGEISISREGWLRDSNNARAIAPLLLSVRNARNDYAQQSGVDNFLVYLGDHLGYRSSTADRFRQQVLSDKDAADNPSNNIEEPTAGFKSQQTLDLGRQFLKMLDLPENPPGLTIQVMPVSDFQVWGTFPVDPPGDVRVALVDTSGRAAEARTFHQFGHAAQALLTPSSGPYTTRRLLSRSVSESCARVAEELIYTPEWLQMQHTRADKFEAIRHRSAEWRAMRQTLANIEFENVFYEDPSKDPDAEFSRIQSSVAGVTVSSREPAWALQKELAFNPRYAVDDLLARCAQAAIYQRLRKLPGGLLGSESLKTMRQDVFEYAAGHRYEEWFSVAAGTQPDCNAWLQAYQ